MGWKALKAVNSFRSSE